MILIVLVSGYCYHFAFQRVICLYTRYLMCLVIFESNIISASDASINHIATGAGGIIRSPTPIPHSIPSILPVQKVPTLSRKSNTGKPTPDLRTPTTFKAGQQGSPSSSQASHVTNPSSQSKSSTISIQAGITTVEGSNTTGNGTHKQLGLTGTCRRGYTTGLTCAVDRVSHTIHAKNCSRPTPS